MGSSQFLAVSDRSAAVWEYESTPSSQQQQLFAQHLQQQQLQSTMNSNTNSDMSDEMDEPQRRFTVLGDHYYNNSSHQLPATCSFASSVYQMNNPCVQRHFHSVGSSFDNIAASVSYAPSLEVKRVLNIRNMPESAGQLSSAAAVVVSSFDVPIGGNSYLSVFFKANLCSEVS